MIEIAQQQNEKKNKPVDFPSINTNAVPSMSKEKK